MNATERIGRAVAILQEIRQEIETKWPGYHDRLQAAKAVGTSIEIALVDLERCCREEAPDLDRFLSRQHLAVAS